MAAKADEKVKVMFLINVKYDENVLTHGDTLEVDKKEAEDFERLGIAKIVK